MKRYQNPDVFEPLAMSYALGTLQGRARARFEKLMAKHFYLRVVTEAYEHQFSGLAGLLPSEEPPPEVWQRLETELGFKENKRQAQQGKKWWDFAEWFHWPAMALASVFAAIVTVMVINSTTLPARQAYFAELKALSSEGVVLASVSKKDMAITIAMTDQLNVADGLKPTLWCLSKKPDEQPIRMGTLNKAGKTELPISTDMFEGLEDVSQFAITLEPEDSPQSGPGGQKVFVGDLISGT